MPGVRATALLSASLLALAGAGVVWLLLAGGQGPLVLAVEGPAGLALGVHADVLSLTLLAYVAALSWLVATYSSRNLAGQTRTGRFGALQLGMLVSLAVLVTGASLPVVAAGWTASGLFMAALVSHSGSPAADRAARYVRRRFLAGDAALWSGVVAALLLLPSVNRTDLAAGALSSPTAVGGAVVVTVVALLLVTACGVRAALVPAHRWLPETAEAPSPVSALLHAGVVNAPAVLVSLFWPLFREASLALLVLLVLGAASVAVGTATAALRPDVKGRLAASTTAQMGYMGVQLGLGLPAAAVVHLIGHGAYKSWLFLRAGGSVSRLRESPAARSASGAGSADRTWWPGTVAVLTTAALGAAATAHLLAAVGPVAAVPVLLALAAATVAATSARRALGAGPLLPVAAVSVGAGAAAAGYLWALTVVERSLAGPLPPAPVWADGAAVSLVAGLVLTGVLSALVATGLRRRDVVHPLAARVALSGLAPWHRRLAGARSSTGTRTGGVLDELPLLRPVDGGDVAGLVADAASVVAPAWPLRTAVAANPLAGLEHLPVEQAAVVAEELFGARALLPASEYARQVREGRLTEGDLVAALRVRAVDLGGRSDETDAAVTARRVLDELGTLDGLGERDPLESATRTWAEPTTSERVAAHAALWCQLAWSTAQDDTTDPYSLWRAHAVLGGYDRITGVPGAGALAASLPTDPAAALATLLGASGTQRSARRLVREVLVREPGWASHAAWRARQHDDPRPLVALAALRLAHDLLAAAVDPQHRPWASRPEPGQDEADAADAAGPVVPAVDDLDLGGARREVEVRSALQTALELRYADSLLQRLQPRAERLSTGAAPAEATARGEATQASAVFCIDVRSERFRRALEAEGPWATHGYAGFFGAAVSVAGPAGTTTDRCPVIVRPSAAVHDAAPGRPRTATAVGVAATAVGSAPLTPLLLAEAGGVLAGAAALARTVAPRRWSALVRRFEDGTERGGDPRWGPARLTSRSEDHGDRAGAAPDGAAAGPGLPVGLDLTARTAMVRGFLVAAGLTDAMPPLLLVVGHGAAVENNAFAAAYDCGACGGSSGHVNARLLAEAVMDPAVRAALAADGICVPDGTVAVAAVHDTTSDTVALDPRWQPPASHTALVERLRTALAAAGARARAERAPGLPGAGGRELLGHTRDRGADWAQPSPEWGLAGNAALVVGPRSLTRGLDLGGRVFLHCYDRAADRDGSMLETVLTAPLVVTHWISSQYLASCVDPDVLGSGDKTTHNPVGDVGVVTGAHGDLRSGLPWQALFTRDPAAGRDGAVHEPMRQLAVVLADPGAVLDVVRRHAGLRALVSGGWLRLCVLHPEDGRALRLTRLLAWEPWDAVSTDRAVGVGVPRVSDVVPGGAGLAVALPEEAERAVH